MKRSSSKKDIFSDTFDTLKQNQMEINLAECENRFKAIVDNSIDAIMMIDDEGGVVFYNNAAEKMFGYSKKEAMGTNIFSLMAPLRLISEYSETYKDIQKTGKNIYVNKVTEFMAKKKDGSEFPVEVSMSTVNIDNKWNTVVVVRDISDRKSYEEAIKKIASGVCGTSSEEIFKSMVKYLTETLDTDFAFIGELNEKTNIVNTIAIYGDGRHMDNFKYDLKGTPCEKVIGGEECLYPTNVQKKFPEDEFLVRMGIDSYMGTKLVNSAGKAFGVMAVLGHRPFKESPLAEMMLRIFASRAAGELERKRMEDEKDDLWRQLLQAQKLESIGRLAGGMAHDFNNIITSIIGYSSLSLDELENDHPAKAKIKRISSICHKASLLTNQLLAFSRKQFLDVKVRNLSNLIAEMKEMMIRLLGDDILLKIDVKNKTGNVRIDESQIEHVIMNLVVNSKDAMPRGGVIDIRVIDAELSDEDAKKIPEARKGSYVMVSIKDTGCGMNEETLENIFEPFFTTKERGKGTGLGLPTALGIIKQHNGFINIKSELDIGTNVKLFLPVTKEELQKDSQEPLSLAVGGNETIFIVEDNYSIRKLFIDILEPLGYKILEAGNAAEALRVSENYKDRIDLLLIDVVLPGMDGYEFSQKFKDKKTDTKIVFMSSYIDNEIVLNKIQKKHLPFIKKPLSPRELVINIRKILDS